MRLCVLLLVTLAALGCGHGAVRRHGSVLVPERSTVKGLAPSSQPATSQPSISDRPALEALQRWTRECYETGLRHDPIFARGGHLLVRWQADRRGDLLFMDFALDSFRGWGINPAGETLADCVVARAREAKVIWSRSGSAPLRLHPIR